MCSYLNVSVYEWYACMFGIFHWYAFCSLTIATEETRPKKRISSLWQIQWKPIQPIINRNVSCVYIVHTLIVKKAIITSKIVSMVSFMIFVCAFFSLFLTSHLFDQTWSIVSPLPMPQRMLPYVYWIIPFPATSLSHQIKFEKKKTSKLIFLFVKDKLSSFWTFSISDFM